MTHPTVGSSPSYTSPSPIRSSPLTAPPHFSPKRSPSPSKSTSRRLSESTSGPSSSYATRRFSQPSSLSRPSRSLLTPLTPSSPPTTIGSPPPHPASPPLSRSQPLLGSYQLSLLHSRMSRTQSHSVPSTSTEGFAVRVGAVGKGKSCPAHLRNPPPLTLPFAATYYDLLDPTGGRRSGASQTPWVGNVDLEQHYIDRYSPHPCFPGVQKDPPPEYPGYQVAPIGQLQIIVKNTTTPLRVFVVPYDLRGLALGSRLLVREKTYVEIVPDLPASSPGVTPRKESLRYAIQLQFICHPTFPSPPNISRDSSTTRRTARQSAPAAPSRLDGDQLLARQYYLSKSLKVIFSAQAPSSSEQLRTERNDEVVPPASGNEVFLGSAGKVNGFSPISGGRRGSEEWEMVRQKWTARRRMEEDSAVAGIGKTAEEGGRADLVSPTATSSPLPILSPSAAFLPVIHSAGPSRTPSRPSTPTTEAFPRVVSPPPGAGPSLLQMSKPRDMGRKSKRRESGSVAERELSERLRSMDMKSGQG